MGIGLPCSQAEQASKLIWHPKEFDPDWSIPWHRGIAPQTLGPREPKARPLCPRQDRRFEAALARRALRLPHLDALLSHKLHAGAPVCSTAPIPPEQWVRTNRERMQQHADLARLCGGAAIPLALRAVHRNDNCECWHHTPRAGSHRLLGGVHARSASAKPGSAASHQAAEQNLGPRSAPLSILIPPEEEHNLPEVLCEVMQAEWQEQTQWCAAALA